MLKHTHMSQYSRKTDISHKTHIERVSPAVEYIAAAAAVAEAIPTGINQYQMADAQSEA